jgi:5'-deoxynucleotidase YfbR-like HD superfamily hydrolase
MIKAFELARKLDYTWRAPGLRVNQPQSVSAHSFQVAFICMMLVEDMDINDVDSGKVLRAAILHDYDEAITGDVSGPFKNGDENLKKAIAGAADRAHEGYVASLIRDGFRRFVPVEVRDRIEKLIRQVWTFSSEHKTDAIADIVKVADRLEFALWCHQEWSSGNEAARGLPWEALRFVRESWVYNKSVLLQSVVAEIDEQMAVRLHGGLSS